MKIDEITDTIKNGIKKGYGQNILLLSSYNDFIKQVREYLLTVNVAQSLLEWNVNHCYKIYIEYPILSFYNNAFPPYTFKDNEIRNYRKHDHSPTDKKYQKIDIAITCEENGSMGTSFERSCVGIELKGINKKDSEILKDIERLANAMLLQDKIDKNSILFGFCGFIKRFHKYNVLVTNSMIETTYENDRQHWLDVCNRLNSKYLDLLFSVDIFEIINTSCETVASIHKEKESDIAVIANETGIVSGGILTVQRK
jgi:hypothetical protein